MNKDAILLLQQLISTQSFSREEGATAEILASFFEEKGISGQRKHNNFWVQNLYYNPELPTILLNSHHDTVKPGKGWSRDPFTPQIEDGKLFGLGSNDAGGPLVALIFTFLHFYEKENLPYNLILAATAEEEISGKNGVALILPDLGKIDLGIIGEPTGMQMAIAEKGLMVIDAEAKGKTGHAARDEGENALYKALEDIQWLRKHQFPMDSELLGPVKMTVTQIEAGYQHNVIPDSCKYVIDVRSNEHYSNQQLFAVLQKNLKAELNARSFRLNSSGITLEHPVVKRGLSLGLITYGSPTLSDQALMNFDTLKIGPGASARSHTADEFIYLHEIEEGMDIYIRLLENLKI
ncbi:MAG: M20 family metallo-hydrolase [Cyclobacteriaceae bacterium]